jgi:flagellin-like hook-associated protein FlgL
MTLAISTVARNVSDNSEIRKRVAAQISSGSKVEDASEDPAATSVALKFKNSGVMMDALQSNMLEASSYLTAQSEALKQLAQQLDRMGELVVQMSDTAKTDQDKQNALAEFDQLREEMAKVQASKFNGLDLFYSQGEPTTMSVSLSTDGASTIDVHQSDLTQQAGWVALLGFDSPYHGIEGVSRHARGIG